jgi:hypothetical protein
MGMGKLRTHSETLPRGIDSVVSLFKRVMQLQNVMEIKVTPEEFIVIREMDEEDDGPVVPKAETSIDADAEHVLARLADNLVEPTFDPNRHPYVALHEATDRLSRDRLRVCGIMAPKGPLFADYFGLPEDTMPETFMGIRVIYHSLENKYPDKIVVFGGPTVYFNDASHGVIIDTGV